MKRRYPTSFNHIILSVMILLLAACGKGTDSDQTTITSLKDLEITSTDTKIAVDGSVKLELKGKNGADEIQTVEEGIEWLSSHPDVANIDEDGNVTGIKEGVVTLIAIKDGEVKHITLGIGDGEIPVSTSTLALNSTSITLETDQTSQLNATLTNNEGNAENVTADVKWLMVNATVASIDASGLITAKAVGNSLIIAIKNGLVKQAKVTVNAATTDPASENAAPVITILGQTSINITVGETYVDEGATATDEEEGDLSDSIAVNSTVDTTRVGNYTVTYDVTDSLNTAATQVVRQVIVENIEQDPNAILISIQIEKPKYKVLSYEKIQLISYAFYNDNSKIEVTNQVEWSSSNEENATVDVNGIVQVLKAGKVSIYAKYENKQTSTGFEIFEIKSASIETQEGMLLPGDSRNIKILGNGVLEELKLIDLTDSTDLILSDDLIANLDGDRLTATSPGVISITANFGEMSVFKTFTIVEPRTLSIVNDVNQVHLSWNGIEGGTEFRLYWNQIGNVSSLDSVFKGITEPFFIHDSLNFGQVYYYRLASVASDGTESDLGDEIRVAVRENKWSGFTAKPTPRSDSSSAVINGKIYVIGGVGHVGSDSGYGRKSATYTKAVEIYDPAIDSWTTGAEMNNVRFGAGSVSDDEKIYILGGKTAGPHGFKADNEVYDPATDTWSTIADMPIDRAHFGTALIDGKIYVIGGARHNFDIDDLVMLSSVDIYDIATDTWSEGLPLIGGRYLGEWSGKITASVFDGKIYVFRTKNQIEIFDPVTNSWSLKTTRDATSGKYGNMRSTTVGNYIYVSGRDGYASLSKYDPINDTWTDLPDVVTSRRATAVQPMGNSIFFVGGENGNPLSLVEIFDAESDSWKKPRKVTEIKAPVAKSATLYNNKIYTFGGFTEGFFSSTLYDEVHEYDLITGITNQKANMLQQQRSDRPPVLIDGKFYSIYTNENIDVYDPIGDSWEQITKIPTSKYSAEIVNINNKLYTFDNSIYGDTETIEIYDPINDSWQQVTSANAKPTGNRSHNLNGIIFTVSSGLISSFDPRQQRWTKRLASESITNGHLSSLNGQLYIFSAFNSEIDKIQVQIFDPKTNTIRPAASIGVSISGGNVFNINDRFYRIGRTSMTPFLTIDELR